MKWRFSKMGWRRCSYNGDVGARTCKTSPWSKDLLMGTWRDRESREGGKKYFGGLRDLHGIPFFSLFKGRSLGNVLHDHWPLLENTWESHSQKLCYTCATLNRLIVTLFVFDEIGAIIVAFFFFGIRIFGEDCNAKNETSSEWRSRSRSTWPYLT